jgi:integrase
MPRKKTKVRGVFEKHPGSGVWYIRYRKNGKSKREMVGSYEDAVAALAKAKLRVKGKLPEDAGTDTGITVTKICETYLEYIKSPFNPTPPKDLNSPKQRLRLIMAELGERSAASLMPFEIRAWLMTLGHKASTLNRYRSDLSSAYRHAKEEGMVTVNPVRDLRQFKVTLPNPRWMQLEEEDRILAVLNRWIADCPAHYRLTKLYLRCHPIELTVAVGTGLRKTNQYTLSWDEHVDMIGRNFHLPPSMTKTGKALDIPMIDDVYDALIELKEIQREIAKILAEDENDTERQRMVADGRVFNISENREWWTKAREEAGVKDLRWHDLRHTFATRLMASSKNMKVVKEACGHGSIATTTRYAHVDNETLHNEMAGLNRKKVA